MWLDRKIDRSHTHTHTATHTHKHKQSERKGKKKKHQHTRKNTTYSYSKAYFKNAYTINQISVIESSLGGAVIFLVVVVWVSVCVRKAQTYICCGRAASLSSSFDFPWESLDLLICLRYRSLSVELTSKGDNTTITKNCVIMCLFEEKVTLVDLTVFCITWLRFIHSNLVKKKEKCFFFQNL